MPMLYTINVYRNSMDSGWLTYDGHLLRGVVTKCWYDPMNRIQARAYESCSATYMKRAYGPDGKLLPDTQWQGIFIPPHKGIFIHQGEDQSWSEGCIVIKYDKLRPIWDDIQPRDARNVLVVVTDTPYLGPLPVE
jgi:hypothetical protein